MDFGKRLKRLLQDEDISQKSFAAALDIAQSTAGNYVNGFREPDYETLKNIASYLHVSIDYLLGFEYEEVEDAELNELLLIFHSLDKKQRWLLLEQGKLLIKSNIK